VVFTNKNVTCQYRAVGHPIAVVITEGIVDFAARAVGMDPLEFRRRNVIPDDAYPYTFPSGLKFEKLSHQQTIEKLAALMEYDKLRAERAELRKRGVYRVSMRSESLCWRNPAAFWSPRSDRFCCVSSPMIDTWTLADRMSGATSTNVTVTLRTRGSRSSVRIAMLTTSRIASAAFRSRRAVIQVSSAFLQT